MQAVGQARQAILVEIAPGELLDKISILDIKCTRITDPHKLANVHTELTLLCDARDRSIGSQGDLVPLVTELKRINERLWEIEDAIRACEREGDFGPRFIELARSVYLTNDRRAAVKRSINDLLQSPIVEEKQYASSG